MRYFIVTYANFIDKIIRNNAKKSIVSCFKLLEYILIHICGVCYEFQLGRNYVSILIKASLFSKCESFNRQPKNNHFDNVLVVDKRKFHQLTNIE